MGGVWAAYLGGPEKQVPEVRTSVPKERLETLLEELNTLPADFTANDKVKKGLEKRISPRRSRTIACTGRLPSSSPTRPSSRTSTPSA